MKITTERLRQIIKEELEASELETPEFGKEPKRSPAEDAVAELIEDEHVEWWENNAPPSLLDDIKKAASHEQGSHGRSHRVPLNQGWAQNTWKRFDEEFAGLRDAARALAKEDFNDSNGGVWFLNALADKLKHKMDFKGDEEEIPGFGEEDEDQDPVGLAEMIKHAIRQQLLGGK